MRLYLEIGAERDGASSPRREDVPFSHTERDGGLLYRVPFEWWSFSVVAPGFLVCGVGVNPVGEGDLS